MARGFLRSPSVNMAAPREAARGRAPAVTQQACGRPGSAAALHRKVETRQMGRTRAGQRMGTRAGRLPRVVRWRGGAGRAGSLRGGAGRPELRPRGVVVKLPHVWREGGKPANKEGKGDRRAKSEGQSPAGGDEPGQAPGTLAPSSQSGDRVATGSLVRREGRDRRLPAALSPFPSQRNRAMLISGKTTGPS